SGRYAMAVAISGVPGSSEAVLAVDSSRLAAVAVLPEEYGAGDPARLATLLRPPSPAPARVEAGELILEARDATAVPGHPATVVVHLAEPDGVGRDVQFGPLTGERATYRATVPECA